MGFASAMRGSELAALTLGDVEAKPGGILVTVGKSKADQEGHGQVVAVAPAPSPPPTPSPPSTPGSRSGDTIPVVHPPLGQPGQPTTPRNHVGARMLRARAEAAGLDGTRITAHSLRAGHATTAALAGVPLDRIAAQTRHKALTVVVNR